MTSLQALSGQFKNDPKLVYQVGLTPQKVMVIHENVCLMVGWCCSCQIWWRRIPQWPLRLCSASPTPPSSQRKPRLSHAPTLASLISSLSSYFAALLNMDMSLHSMEVVNRLTSVSLAPSSIYLLTPSSTGG